MKIIDEIITALSMLEPSDLATAEKYLLWMKFRRHVNNHFYFRAHWLTRPVGEMSARQAHWI